jgi:mRNA interferase HigB
VRIISKGTLREFWEKPEYADAEQPLKSWYKEITGLDWKNPHEITDYFKDTDAVGNGRIVFNICRNKYRLIVYFRYDLFIGYVRFLGTHKQYDRIEDIKNI